jgi:hypothetical protein
MDDVFSRRTPQQVAGDAAHTQEQLRIKTERESRESRCYICKALRDEHDRKHWAGLCHECGERAVAESERLAKRPEYARRDPEDLP